MSKTNTPSAGTRRYVIVAVLVLVAFFASYRFALAARADAGTTPGVAYATAGQSETGADSLACACCGGAGSSTPIEGAATTDTDGIQRITVDTSSGSYDPNVINLAAGVPAQITFKQASGCLAQAMSTDLDFFEDISSGDTTISLDALSAGTYEFSCGMQMVFGQIVVE